MPYQYDACGKGPVISTIWSNPTTIRSFFPGAGLCKIAHHFP